MNSAIRKVFPPADPADVALLESLIGRKLPSEYRSFLLEYNGGEAINELIEVGNVTLDINGYLTLDRSSPICIFEYLEHTEDYGRLALPFATDLGGQFYLIHLDNIQYGQIWHWAHHSNNKSFVALNFQEFVNMTFPDQ